ncbi:MAG: polysaccharide deacetylase family protein [Rhodospirillaceae bacterium]|jgi:peptidoglycan/xylan/chitin deacetylase (PgdA/CDA1 family)|nr:polysaccharide deacetylase family protein [Rhodospirillaceae bacterium]
MEPRPYGPFNYVPVNRRPKITWPGGARVALWVAPNIEYFALDEPLPGDAHERPGASAHTPMVREWGARDYGNRVGVFRIMEVLERYGIRATVSLNSKVCDAFPEIIEDCLKLDWEFMGHCQGNMHRLSEIPPESEREYIHETMARIKAATGKQPAGWLGAGLAETWNTLDYLVEEGCLYVSDWVNDDQPYMMDIDGKPLVYLPYSFETNDSPAIGRKGYTPGEFERMIKDQFDVLYREGAESGRVMAICLHPFIIGQPHRIGALDRALDYICKHSGVWKATGSEIVNHYLKSGVTW